MKIMRYSLTGYEPHYQDHRLDEVNYHLNDFDITVYPEFMRETCMDIHNKKLNFFKENYADFQCGIWAFIDGYIYNMELNHLKREVPCWKAEISDNTIVYDVNWEYKMNITDERCKIFGFYIPANQLSGLKIIA